MLELVLAKANGQPRPAPFSWGQQEQEEEQLEEAAAEDAAAPGKALPSLGYCVLSLSAITKPD